jgi:hypothetical protein
MTKLEKLLNDHLLSENDAENACTFVADLLELMADATEKDEPYAVGAIQRYRDVASELFDYASFVDYNGLKEAA